MMQFTVVIVCPLFTFFGLKLNECDAFMNTTNKFRRKEEFHGVFFHRWGNMWDTLGGCGKAALPLWWETNRQTDRWTSLLC